VRAALAACLLVAACAHASAPEPTEADAVRVGTPLDELVAGRRLYVGHCGSCHVVPQPSDHSATAWPGHVAEMRERAGLSVDESKLVERYVITMASR
jgi:mono/diheme cytochrome c family protein